MYAVVHGQDLCHLRQGGWCRGLDAAQAGRADARRADHGVARYRTRDAADRARDLQRRLLGLPCVRDVPAAAPGFWSSTIPMPLGGDSWARTARLLPLSSRTRFPITATIVRGAAPGSQGARRENSGDYLSVEQRSEAGCPARNTWS